MPRDFKVLIIGLDGATFDLMLPWIEQGRLPHLARLLSKGAHSELKSTVPPITPCAWSSLITGKNPGKHGLFDFVEPVPESHSWRFTNASSREGESLWGCLSRHNRRVGVVNVPMTFPPEPVNGFMISGLDTPHEGSDYMYPPAIRDELDRQSIRYRIDQQHLGNMNSDRRRTRQLAAIFDAESARTKTLCHLTKTHPTDFRMIVYGATDQVQHHFWQYMDPNHDKYDADGAQKFQHAIRDTYEHVDQQVGQLLGGIDDDTVVMVMSDHGFGPTTNVRIRLNQVLEQGGWLRFETNAHGTQFRRRVMGLVDRVLRSTLSSDMKRTIAGRFPTLRVWFEGLEGARIDWKSSQAHCHETYRSSPAIWLTSSDTEILDDVENALLDLKDPQSGKPAISQVVRPRELYHGPFTHKAPHLLPAWWKDGFLLERSVPGAAGNSSVERSVAPIRGGVEFAGSHRMQGVFMASGGPVKKSWRFEGAQIIDVAPTVLYLMGLPVPDDMDGQVLTACLDQNFVSANPIELESTPEHRDEIDVHEFTASEEGLITQRLQALGYLE